MSNYIFKVFIGFFVLFVLNGCVEKTPMTTPPSIVVKMVENLETPSWVSSPQMEGYIVGVGMANPSIGDFHEQKLTAQKDAIDNIKKQKAVTTESEVSQLKFWINPNTNDLYLMMGLKIKPE